MPSSHHILPESSATPRKRFWAAVASINTYATRVLLSTALTLGTVLAVLHLPIYTQRLPIGWYVSTPRESVDLIEIQEEAKTTYGAPITRIESNVDKDVGDAGDWMPEDEAETITEATTSDDLSSATKLKIRRVFDFTQQMPEIVGGLGSYYINIEYPDEALRRGIQGRLVLSFVVEADGRTSAIEVIQSLHPLCDSAAVRALRSTVFVPGHQNGKAVPVRMHLPVRFKLISPDPNQAAADALVPNTL